jgi:hypothetical protein
MTARIEVDKTGYEAAWRPASTFMMTEWIGLNLARCAMENCKVDAQMQ